MFRSLILLFALLYCEIRPALSDIDSPGLCENVNDRVDESLEYANSWMRTSRQDSQTIAGFQLKVPILDRELEIGVETRDGKVQNLDSLHRYGNACEESRYEDKILRGGLQYDNLVVTFDDVDVEFFFWKYKASLSYTVQLGLNFTIDKSPDECSLTSFEITTKDRPDFQFSMPGWTGWLLARMLRSSLMKHDLTPILGRVKTESYKSVSSYFVYYWCWNWRYSTITTVR
ncbi:Hypothetical protein NTJ_04691 [Nesidiocoris tenuis]|uniref:Uncharacterized protein n=1 Tax=Nesidiocoris tenuis TaxID=355587 RepID=A0ABN7AHY9_9HEMI|nr:Hypothetical protein NTJ_04691 [Nesidiocoris tenuis]